MHVPSIIEKKRDGGELSESEIREIITGFTSGDIPDYQMSALAMAVFYSDMTGRETAALTRAMLESGDVMSYPEGHPTIVDKHSTGGVGDKVSLILAPLVACDESVWVPMISGRGLGITGGTLDKLESIPGFNVNVSEVEALKQLEKIGVVMMGQTGDICPADKKLYALRDVTGTVPSQPLIVASIMSKKLAESLDRLVLDVKHGSGAFMKTEAEAMSLANRMKEVGEAMNVEVSAVLNPMNEPLGCAVGNALEVAESIDILQGQGPEDLRELVLDLSEVIVNVDRQQLASWLDDGTAWNKFVSLVECQGGSQSDLDNFREVHVAPINREIRAEAGGSVRKVDAETVGRASLQLGAGRAKFDDDVDFAVGFSEIVKVGDGVEEGDTIGMVHARNEAAASDAAARFLSGVEIV